MANLYYTRWTERHEDGYLYPHTEIYLADSEAQATAAAHASAATRGHTATIDRVAPAGPQAEATADARPTQPPAPTPRAPRAWQSGRTMLRAYQFRYEVTHTDGTVETRLCFQGATNPGEARERIEEALRATYASFRYLGPA